MKGYIYPLPSQLSSVLTLNGVFSEDILKSSWRDSPLRYNPQGGAALGHLAMWSNYNTTEKVSLFFTEVHTGRTQARTAHAQ